MKKTPALPLARAFFCVQRAGGVRDQLDLLRPALKATPLANSPYGVTTVINTLGLTLLAAVILMPGGRDARPLTRSASASSRRRSD